MILFSDNNDIAMQYEGLARHAFGDCAKYGDRYKFAASDAYNNNILNPNFFAKTVMFVVLKELANKYSDEIRLKELLLIIENVEEQEKVIDIIEETISIVNNRF